jgi:lipid-binding SYLF domain-containing protein
MKLHRLLTAAAVMLLLAAGTAFGQTEKAKKQAEVQKAAEAALEKFYKADPKIRGEVEQAPGYAVFTTYGVSFIFGGAGGKGLVHDNKTKRVTYMDLAKASAGAQIGLAESETLVIFRTMKGMEDFVSKGWEFGGGGAVQAGAAGKSVGPASGVSGYPEATHYTLTKNGLQAGVAVSGVKVWKDKELN